MSDVKAVAVKPAAKPYRKGNGKKNFKRGGSASVRIYSSVCCSEAVKKEPTGKLSDAKGNAGVVTDSDGERRHGLGGWRCNGCGKPCSVKVTLVKVQNADESDTSTTAS